MIVCPTVTKDAIRRHYEVTTLFYWLLWGRHIHHGLWHADESPKLAQQQLMDALAGAAAIGSGERVLDVGCGVGGSSIHLARTFGGHVTGLTVSRVQRRWASWSARWRGLSRAVDIRCVDAEAVDFPPETFDVIWSIECTEHLFDKPAFFRRAATWLRPGGRLAICAWLAGESLDDAAAVRQVFDVCEGFLCPSLGSREDYQGWFRDAGLTQQTYEDLTDRVSQTWEICYRRVRRSGLRWLAPLVGRDEVLFFDRFETILHAYRSGAMRYGRFVAQAPTAS